MSLRSEFRVVVSVTISAENDVRFVSTSSCLEGGHVLFTLFVFVCVLSCPTYIVLYFSSYWYPMLSVSFNCPFLIARSVFSNVYIVL